MPALRTTVSVLVLALGWTACGPGGGGQDKDAPPQNLEAAYAIGLLAARSLEQLHLSTAERAEFDRGIRDYENGTAPATLLREIPRVQPFQMERLNFAVERERASAEEFLRTATAEPGAEQLPSGIVVRSLVKAAEGKSPSPTDRAVVRAEGTLPDGLLFMSSQLQERPFAVDMQTGIPCLTEPLARMTVGSKARITCPPHTGYALQDKPALIPTGSALRFEIELVDVQPNLGIRHGG